MRRAVSQQMSFADGLIDASFMELDEIGQTGCITQFPRSRQTQLPCDKQRPAEF
jgi:hypothetical protein